MGMSWDPLMVMLMVEPFTYTVNELVATSSFSDMQTLAVTRSSTNLFVDILVRRGLDGTMILMIDVFLFELAPGSSSAI